MLTSNRQPLRKETIGTTQQRVLLACPFFFQHRFLSFISTTTWFVSFRSRTLSTRTLVAWTSFFFLLSNFSFFFETWNQIYLDEKRNVFLQETRTESKIDIKKEKEKNKWNRKKEIINKIEKKGENKNVSCKKKRERE